ncbi:hypothetical protein OG562_45435 [Streptomyces sp. NBC_01275]|uniref:hypothetical protein n=1 Tax=Streptomyces sp. NBC_01275 TaxID=2903807 RepID=UPI0022518C20|nr:hypothetical protein [Streptomyces sp. NBC_01275]MCX4768045.1 hypothetical protein [Streptomyces sp. NBC_01275]
MNWVLVNRMGSVWSGGEEVGHLLAEGLGVLEEERVASAGVEHEGGVGEVLA